MPEEIEVKTHPVQKSRLLTRETAACPQVVTMRAYEVYCKVFRPQEALITGECRGGFGLGELVAFLYARSFPQSEWDARFKEALGGMKL